MTSNRGFTVEKTADVFPSVQTYLLTYVNKDKLSVNMAKYINHFYLKWLFFTAVFLNLITNVRPERFEDVKYRYRIGNRIIGGHEALPRKRFLFYLLLEI